MVDYSSFGNPLGLNPANAVTSGRGFPNLNVGGISSIAGGIGDLFASDAYKAKAAGDLFEQQNYQLAAGLADKNAQYAQWSTAIQVSQQDRSLFKSLGETRADVAGAGFAESGSALDILRESASQGALAHAVLSEQGLITVAGYQEQAASYRNMAAAAQVAIDAENKAASGSILTGALKIGAGIASLFAL